MNGLRVLITGGYGFIGSHVADFFFKEGHHIFIIDNLSSGSTSNIKFKHKSYLIDTNDKRCDEVFKANNFDVIVHCASLPDIVKSVENPLADSKSDFLGITNMLNLTTKHKISKFVLISSTSVYGNPANLPAREDDVPDPVSISGTSKLTTELYCRKWSELYNLSTVILRVSNAYGPRQKINSENSIISELLDKVINSQDLTVNAASGQTRDFIYVEDIAQAVFKATELGLQGLYNLSSGVETSIDSVVELIKNSSPVKGVVKYNSQKSGIEHFFADNKKIKRELDWVPLYSVEEGIRKTFSWQVSNPINKSSKITKKKNVQGFFSKTIMPYIENFTVFSLIIVGSLFFKDNISDKLPLFLSMYILFIGIVYGTRQSIICVILSCSFYIYNQVSMGREPISMVYDSGTIFQISLFILIGLAVGYTIDKKENRIHEKINEIELLQTKYDFLSGIYNDTRIVKDQLYSQIVSSEDSFGKVFNLIKQLDSLSPDEVYYSAIHVIESVMKSKKVSLYIISGNGCCLRLMTKSNTEDFILPNSIMLDENNSINDVIVNKTMYTNNTLDSSMPLMIAPVINGKHVVAIIAIYEADFDNITLYYKNLFLGAVELISESISKAIKYENLMTEKKYIDDTSIMKSEYFAELLKIKLDAKSNLNTDFVLLEINAHNATLIETSHILINILREYDFVGMIDNQIFILLSNTSAKQSQKVIERLADTGFEIVSNGAIAYD